MVLRRTTTRRGPIQRDLELKEHRGDLDPRTACGCASRKIQKASQGGRTGGVGAPRLSVHSRGLGGGAERGRVAGCPWKHAAVEFQKGGDGRVQVLHHQDSHLRRGGGTQSPGAAPPEKDGSTPTGRCDKWRLDEGGNRGGSGAWPEFGDARVDKTDWICKGAMLRQTPPPSQRFKNGSVKH